MSRATESRVATAYARTREHLGYLGLPTASEHLAAELERAKQESSAPVEVLERLLAAEVEATVARRLSGRLRFAHYPLAKRLVDFELDFQPSIDRAVIAELSTLRFVEERRNALFLGHFGGSGEVRRDHGSGGAPLTVNLSVVLQRGAASVELLSPDGTKQLSSSLTGPATLTRTLSFSGQNGIWLVVIAFQDAEGEYRLDWRE